MPTGRSDTTLVLVEQGVADRAHNGVVLFADLVAVSERVRDLESRQDKVAELSTFFRTGTPIDVPMCAELLVRDDLFSDQHVDTELPAEIEPRAHPSLSCTAVVDAIVEIDRAPAIAIRRNLVLQLLARATSDEQRWITNAVDSDRLDTPTFDLIISAAARSTRVTVGALRRAAWLTGSLPLAVRLAAERGAAGLQSVTIEPGRPIVLTLAGSKESPGAILESAKTHLAEILPRADRIQVHRVRGEVFVYDDQLRDVTDATPGVVEQVATFSRGDLVLDGWVDIALAAETQPTTVASRTRRHDVIRSAGPAQFFDILFDGAAIVDEPLANRRTLLRSVVPEDSLLPVLTITNLDDVARALDSAVRSGHQGVVLKPLDEPYEGGLVRSSWRSVDAVHVVKLAVTAVERSTGPRTDLLSSVHLAARDDRGRLQDVGTTDRGLGGQTDTWQAAAFASLMVDEEPVGLARIRPGIVAIVAIDGVNFSSQLPGQLTVERPHVLGYQPGSRSDVTSLEDLRAIAGQDADETLEAERGDLGDDTQPILPRLPAAPPVSTRPAPAPAPAPAPIVGDSEPVGKGTPLPAALDARPRAGLRERRAIAELQPYQEPVIPQSRAPWRAVIVARAIATVWVLALLVASLADRGGADGTTGGAVSAIGRVGLVVALLLAVTGWWWSDQLVRTLTQLDGRRPGRVRCVSAWLIPPTVMLLIALVVVPIEPTKPADVRPMLIIPAFALAMWRPYSLIRRILATLIRLRSDAILASAYIIDLLGFGVLWWQLTQWEQRDEIVSSGQRDVLVGTVAAVSVFMIMSTVLWIGVLRTAENAVAHRRSSQRTRYEHRMLRLSGIDPNDPEVWWALVQRRADEERAAADREQTTEELTALPTVDELIESARREHNVEFRRLDDDEAQQLEERLRTEFTAILADRGADVALTDPASGPEETDAPTRRDLEELINRAGSLQIESALAERRDKAGQDGPSVRLLPPRLFALEASRLVMVAIFGALAITTGWLVAISLSSDAIAGTNELDPSVLNDIETARKIIWGLLTIGGAIVPLWALMMLRQARVAGIGGLRERRARVLLLVAAGACAFAFVADSDRGGTTLLLTVLIIWTAVSAGLAVEPIRLWYEVPAATLTAWIATLPAILGITWLAGLAATVEPSVSLQRLAFASILLMLGCARVTALSWLSSVDLEDEFRSAPELAVPARATARR